MAKKVEKEHVKDPNKDSCPYINVANCPYTKETKSGCPFKAKVADKTINVPAYCPLTK